MNLALIWAQTPEGVIGANGTMPWHLPEDLAHFKQHTHGAPVLMGKRTWQSLPEAARPLPARRNIVLTTDPAWTAPGALVAHTIADALALAGAAPQVWVIGGASVYEQLEPFADRAEITTIDVDATGDTYAPTLPSDWSREKQTPWLTSRTGLRYRFETWIRDRRAGC